MRYVSRSTLTKHGFDTFPLIVTRRDGLILGWLVWRYATRYRLDDSHTDSSCVILSYGIGEAQVTYLDLHIRVHAEEHSGGIPLHTAPIDCPVYRRPKHIVCNE